MRFGCTKQLNLLVLLGWVGMGRDFSIFDGFGWVGSSIGKVLKCDRIVLLRLKRG